MRLTITKTIVALLTVFFAALPLWAHGDSDKTQAHGEQPDAEAGAPWSAGRPDGHAPIGVMGEHTHHSGEHTHHSGEWMASYRYMFMDMDGNRGRGGSKSTRRVLDDFMVAPTRMYMEMHMLGFMHAPNDDLTLTVMLPYVLSEMDHRTRSGAKFTTRSDGPGDVRLGGLRVLHRWKRQQVHLNAGVSLPTGSINEKDDTPAGANTKLPYPMQLGSGTFDLLPGVTYLGQTDDYSWGAQAMGTFRLGRNSESYALGDRGQLTFWGARKWTNWFSSSLRIDSQIWGNIDGDDEDLNPAVVPTADPDRRGGERIDLLVGMNFYGRESWVKGQRLALEFGVPIYQSLDGPQLETDWLIQAGWQYAW